MRESHAIALEELIHCARHDDGTCADIGTNRTASRLRSDPLRRPTSRPCKRTPASSLGNKRGAGDEADDLGELERIMGNIELRNRHGSIQRPQMSLNSSCIMCT